MHSGPRERRLRGQCVCGEVAYEVDDAFEYAVNCHCSDCQRKTGGAFKPFAGIAIARFEITRGAEALQRFGSTNHDAHCVRCSAFLYSVVRDGAWVHLNLGGLVDAPSIRPAFHIFVASKAPWFDILDDLPQFSGHAP